MELPLSLRALPSPGALSLDAPWRSLLAARRKAAVGAVAVLLLGSGWLWLRDSSLASVQQVKVSGLRGQQAEQIEAALRAAARHMSTLHFDAGALRSAVAAFPVVKAVRASTSFPHAVRIQVIERPPVAVLQAAGGSTAVAADGTVLGPAFASKGLPLLNGSYAPAPGQRVGGQELAAVTVLGAAPRALLRFVARVYTGKEGLTAAMTNGLLVYFGDARRPHAKWLALVRVLADPEAAHAVYVDVRVPERPAAGGVETTTAPAAQGASETVGSLAERLSAAAGGGAASSAPAPSESASAGTESASSGSGESAPAERVGTTGGAASTAASPQSETAAGGAPQGAAETRPAGREGPSGTAPSGTSSGSSVGVAGGVAGG